MDYVNIELEYLSEYNSFGVADKVIEDLANKNIVPIITLKDEDYSRIGCNLPRKKAPLIAFLLGRETGYYTIDFSYAKTLALCGVRLRFLTYGQNVDQMNGVDGLMLPGGEFDSHCEFYAKVDEKNRLFSNMNSFITKFILVLILSNHSNLFKIFEKSIYFIIAMIFPNYNLKIL